MGTMKRYLATIARKFATLPEKEIFHIKLLDP